MGESFSKGEIAIIHNDRDRRYNGDECEVTDLPQSFDYVSSCGKLTCAGKYTVLFRGNYVQVSPRYLRKKRPPDHPDNVTTWDSVPWWPEALVRKQPAVTA